MLESLLNSIRSAIIGALPDSIWTEIGLHGPPEHLRFAFEQPFWIWGLLAIPFVLLLAWGWLRRAAAWRRGAAAVTRTLILALLVIALARPTVWEPDEHLAVALVVDRSDSMTGVVGTAADQWLQDARTAARPDDRVATVRFGRQAVADGPSGGPAQVDGTATNLEAAIRMAGDMLPPTGERRVVVVSDGWENVGDAERAALDSARNGLAVSFAGLTAAAEAPEV